MGLSDVLSAIRELVLDEPVTEADSADRQKLLADRFPALDAEEVADLAAVAPDRLAIYTNLIYAGQRSTLQWIFPVTFAVIHQIRDRIGPGVDHDLADFELARDLQSRVPWTSSSTRQLARNVQRYIAEFRRDLVEAWPGLNDLVDYERTDLDLFYAPDVGHQKAGSNDLQRILDVEVSALMDVRLFRPGYIGLRSYDHDAHGLVTTYKAEERLPDPLPGVDAVRLACGRHVDSLMPAWVVLSPGAEGMLRSAPANTPVAVNDLANAYIEALGPDHGQSEEECFVAFFNDLQTCLLAGIFLRPE